MIRLRLREVMQRRQRTTGQRVTYESLAKKTGLSRATIEAIGSRATYNPSLSTLDRLCDALGCSPADLIQYSPGATRARLRGRR